MTALTQDRKTDRLNPEDSVLPLLLTPTPIEANTNCFAGGMGAYNANRNIVPASATAGLIVVGRIEADVLNNPGSAGVQQVPIRPGAYYYNNGTGVDAISNANIGSPCYASDDNTVNLTDGGVNRPVAGTILGLNPNGNGQVGVMLGMVWPYAGGFIQHTTILLTLAQIQATTSGTPFNIGAVLPANYRLFEAEVVTTQTFAGGGVTGVTVSLGVSGANGSILATGSSILTAGAINAAPGSNPFQQRGGAQLQALITNTGGTNATLTAGTLQIDLFGAIIQ